jgi:DNA-binding LacI/PurR family transcriptional regulator
VKPTGTRKSRKSLDEVGSRGAGIPMHRAIYEELLGEIQSGVYGPGERLPSEALLCERFGASRITVAKAFQTLQNEGMVVRRPGSGTYVEMSSRTDSLQFGLLIPDLGTTEIFEPICQGIMHSPAAKSHSLSWGHSTGKERDPILAMEALCKQYIAQKVSGVFFAPSEHSEVMYACNQRIATMLRQAAIPVVLLDRCFQPYPDRSEFDLVGIDNHRAGFILARHLLQVGAKRIIFATRANSAPTVNARIAGYHEALHALGSQGAGAVVSGDFEDANFVKEMLRREKPDGVLCSNDVTAARLMHTLISLGIDIPGEVMMAGVDDVRYAKFLPKPLTTIRQDCAAIGAAAMGAMISRLEQPEQPVRDIYLRFELVVRASSGGSAGIDQRP